MSSIQYSAHLLGERVVQVEFMQLDDDSSGDPAPHIPIHLLATVARQLQTDLQSLWPGAQCIQTHAALSVMLPSAPREPLCLLAQVEQLLAVLIARLQQEGLPPQSNRRHVFKTQYGGLHGEDLPRLAEHLGTTEAALIQLHSEAEYTVEFLGFLPGFAYLAGLPKALHVPRLASPRAQVAAGSLAIAGGYCAVYPWQSPGGWHCIGHVNTVLFDAANQDGPSLLQPGDRVVFLPEGKCSR